MHTRSFSLGIQTRNVGVQGGCEVPAWKLLSWVKSSVGWVIVIFFVPDWRVFSLEEDFIGAQWFFRRLCSFDVADEAGSGHAPLEDVRWGTFEKFM